MAYKLLVEMDIDFASPYKRLLSPHDVLRGELVKLTFFVTNLGRARFPGGKVKNWRIESGPGREVKYTSSTANVRCKPILPGRKMRLLTQETVPISEGLAWVILSIEPEGDEKTVRYYQSTKDPLSGNEWMGYFYVVDREMVQLTSLIEELITKLEPSKG